jgi:hypothetical protein
MNALLGFFVGINLGIVAYDTPTALNYGGGACCLVALLINYVTGRRRP